jgi:hypothetical protein
VIRYIYIKGGDFVKTDLAGVLVSFSSLSQNTGGLLVKAKRFL